jgi:hypothetical protein
MLGVRSTAPDLRDEARFDAGATAPLQGVAAISPCKLSNEERPPAGQEEWAVLFVPTAGGAVERPRRRRIPPESYIS